MNKDSIIIYLTHHTLRNLKLNKTGSSVFSSKRLEIKSLFILSHKC